MMRIRSARIAALTIAAAAAFTFAGAGAAQGAPAIPLTGGQESPRPNDFGAHGSFSYEIDDALNEFCYTLDVTGLSAPATAAHVHVAPRNTPGPVVMPPVLPHQHNASPRAPRGGPSSSRWGCRTSPTSGSAAARP